MYLVGTWVIRKVFTWFLHPGLGYLMAFLNPLKFKDAVNFNLKIKILTCFTTSAPAFRASCSVTILERRYTSRVYSYKFLRSVLRICDI